jgi:hypothetical protein
MVVTFLADIHPCTLFSPDILTCTLNVIAAGITTLGSGIRYMEEEDRATLPNNFESVVVRYLLSPVN